MARSKLDSRTYGIITYPDNYELNEKLRTYNYACIFHHSDVWTHEDERTNPNHKEGEKKEPHIHWILRFDNTRSINRLAADLGLNVGRLEAIRCLSAQIRYLIHYDDPEKFQYDKSEIEHTFPIDSFFKSYIEEDDGFHLLFDYILNTDNINWVALTKYALDNNCIKVLRRYSYHFNCILNDLKK